ncbi:DUF2087 domain-containing protein [Hathewaya massiliensis]|uniref:DUF2087 domain-containing protein n=1 Tax=Hathewaya massiliensis TaxID=1964382 RepID=UPI003C12BA86
MIFSNNGTNSIKHEKEVNRILQIVYEDYATIRRALIEYGFITFGTRKPPLFISEDELCP